jgi:tetratricopeptide (TPR) repeat protein
VTSTERTHELSPYASFPVDCPHCGQQTTHACGRIRKHLSLRSLSIPKGLPSLYVQCVECKLVRQVPRADRGKLRPLIKDDAIAYALKHAGERETSLGRVTVDPDRIRLLPIKAIGKTTRAIFYLVGLLLLLGIGSLFYQGGRTIYQNACLLRGVRLAKKAIALADDGKYKAAVRHLNRAQLLVKSAGRPYDQTACLIVMGHLRLRLGDYPGAIRAYEKSLRVSERQGCTI